MDYEPKGPTKSMGVSPYPVYGIVSSLGTLALTIIGVLVFLNNFSRDYSRTPKRAGGSKIRAGCCIKRASL